MVKLGVVEDKDIMRVTHRHVTLPAQVVPVEGDGGVVKLRVLIKMAVQQRHRARTTA